jgi:hypothetical protein
MVARKAQQHSGKQLQRLVADRQLALRPQNSRPSPKTGIGPNAAIGLRRPPPTLPGIPRKARWTPTAMMSAQSQRRRQSSNAADDTGFDR